MVQFKDVFLGTGRRPYTRAVDAQKCMRVAGKHNDLDDVGKDSSHHTFFEMLGNWSFGDYYKKDAIAWAWQLLTEVWNLPKSRLWATCFEDEQGVIARDDEAAKYWLQQPGFEPNHLVFFGRHENFWEMADIGPCGPDSEVHFDLGAEHCDQQGVPGHVCRINGDCARWLELWNLVFIQYNRTGPTELETLPDKHVDTGMGLERIVSLLQGRTSNYHTDLFSPLLDTVQQLSGHDDNDRANHINAYRVIADHARAATFLIADGVTPGNTGRNYVCRMVIRRASRFGTRAGFSDPFLAQVADTVIEEYGDAYPELVINKTLIQRTLTDEENRFQHTVDLGISHLNSLIAKLNQRKQTHLPGVEAFELYATYGLPLEITRDVLREHKLSIHADEFDKAMEAHRLASGGGKITGEISPEHSEHYVALLEELQSTDQLGDDGVENDPYLDTEFRGPILTILRDGLRVDSAEPGDEVEVVLARTPFYVESGGQISDNGTISSFAEETDKVSPWEIQVTNCHRPIAALVTHFGKVVSGYPKQGDDAVAQVNIQRRSDIARNHSATHLLHAGLRSVLGDHVRQAGSLVTSERLRFDFTHDAAVTEHELAILTQYVNQAILANLPITIQHQRRQEALSTGATALFGEKYGDIVRTTKIREASKVISFELCGGTHVDFTGKISIITILSETSVAAGIRRIEAVTGSAAHHLIEQHLAILSNAADHLQVQPNEVHRKALSLLESERDLQKAVTTLHRQQAKDQLERALGSLIEVDGVEVMVAKLNVSETFLLREMADWFRQRVSSGVAVFGANINGRPALITTVTKDLTMRGLHAGKLAMNVAQLVGGRGGGKDTLAQAGGKDPESLSAALDAVPNLVSDALAVNREV